MLVRRAHAPEQGRWAVPGGRVNAGETLVDAVRREVAEETGLYVRGRPQVLYVVRLAHVAGSILVVDYGVTAEGEIQPGSDADAVAWVDEAQAAALPLAAGMAAFLGHPRVRAFLGWARGR